MQKRKVLFSIVSLLFVLMAAFPSAVDAVQLETNTPAATPTITAPPVGNPVVATSNVYGDITCPVGGIVGWGTLTPSSSWNLLCSQCVVTPMTTSTPHPSDTPTPVATWNGTGTPSVTTTVTATSTITVTPTLIPSACGDLEATTLYSDNNHVNITTNTLECVSNSGIVNCSGDVVLVDNNESSDGWIYYAWDLTAAEIGTAYYYDASSTWFFSYDGLYYNNKMAFTIDGTGQAGSFDAGQLNASGSLLKINSNPPKLQIWVPCYGPAGTTCTAHIDLTVSTVASCLGGTPTPTPEVTSTPVVTTSYCDSVSETEDGFDWSGIEYGDTVCWDLGGPGFDDNGSGWWDWFVHDLWLTFGSPSLPWIAHICMQDVSFGVAQIFGVSISLEIILYIVGIITLIRNMFVS